jgi:hypothetical protein
MYPRSSCTRLNHLKKAARATPAYLKHREERQPFQVLPALLLSYLPLSSHRLPQPAAAHRIRCPL